MRFLLAVSSLLVACGGPSMPDAGAGRDSGAQDGGGADGSAGDAGGADAGEAADAGRRDAGPIQPTGPWTVYVTVGAQRRLAVVDLALDGSCSERAAQSVALGARPGPLAYDSAGSRLFVGLFEDAPGFATLSLGAGGQPTLVGRTDGDGPVFVGFTADQRLVSGYFGLDSLRVHDVASAPPHAELSRTGTLEEPHASFVGPNGLVYVPHRNGMTTRWYRVEGDGSLALVGELASEPNTGPRHIAFHPNGRFAYVVNEFGDSVSTHTVGVDGALTRLETVLALDAPDDQSSAADVHVTPDGRFLYSSQRDLSNGGGDVIARFSVGGDGRLTRLGVTAVDSRPREFELTPGGEFLLALGQNTGFLAVYRIGEDGDLSEVSRLELGGNLLWAIAVPAG